MAKQKSAARNSKTAAHRQPSGRLVGGPVHRFAHPFFTETPPQERKAVPGVGHRMTDHIVKTLLPIPDPIRNPPAMTLDEIIGTSGTKAIKDSGAITFHAVGDTGHAGGATENMQDFVADAMTADFNIAHPEKSPTFLFHLGDVNYYDNTDKGYHEQFYVPYKKYPGKIIAIPGNHDGELFRFDGKPVGQNKTLDAFIRNFVQPQPSVPPAAGSIFRQMVSQPGVYWSLQAPFVDIIGLYSNMAENPGFISASTIGTKQKVWLQKVLADTRAKREAGNRKALIVAVHHPPYSNGSHGGSIDMLADIDDACTKAGIMPDAVLAAHSHDVQFYTRFVPFGGKDLEIPFVVCGGGGRGLSQHLKPADGKRDGDVSYDKSLLGYGYLTITVTPKTMKISLTQVKAGGAKHEFYAVSVDLLKNKVLH